MNNIDWSSDPGDGDRTEEPTVIAQVQAKRMSVGEAYRSTQFIPDFVVLWQIGRHGMALALIALYGGLLAAIAAVVITLNPLAVAGFLILLVANVLTSWFVFVSLEEWVEEYNLTVDDELRRVLGR